MDIAFGHFFQFSVSIDTHIRILAMGNWEFSVIRIHFSIDYPELDLDARRTIWGMFLRRTSESKEVFVDIGDDELVELAKLQLNGRQIKNAVKIVHTIALRNDVPITSASIHRALKFTVS